MIITFGYKLVFLLSIVLILALAVLDSARFSKKYPAKTLHAWRNILSLLLLVAIVYLCFENFPVSLTLLVIGTGIIALIDLFLSKKRKGERGVLTKNAREFFPVLLLVWVIRSFIIQPYHVPSGSLEPTITPGDFIVVKQYPYGLRFPIGNFTMIPTGKPKIGDIALFYNPTDPTKVFVKRVIGTPGDRIAYKNKVLFINGKEAKQQFISADQDVEPGMQTIMVNRMSEDLNGVKHEIFVQPVGGETADFDIIVPENSYFMMGDNRDNSDDSRTAFGSGELTFVPDQNLIGQAKLIWMSWDGNNRRIDWGRIGKVIK